MKKQLQINNLHNYELGSLFEITRVFTSENYPESVHKLYGLLDFVSYKTARFLIFISKSETSIVSWEIPLETDDSNITTSFFPIPAEELPKLYKPIFSDISFLTHNKVSIRQFTKALLEIES